MTTVTIELPDQQAAALSQQASVQWASWDGAGRGNLFLDTGRLGPIPQRLPNDSPRSPQRARAFFALCPNDTDLEYFLMTLWAVTLRP